MGKVGKARITRVETVGGVWWVGQGRAESLGEDGSSSEVGGAGGQGWESVLRKPIRQALVRLVGLGQKALGKEGRRHRDGKDPSQPWKAQGRLRAESVWVQWCPSGQIPMNAQNKHLPFLVIEIKSPSLELSASHT